MASDGERDLLGSDSERTPSRQHNVDPSLNSRTSPVTSSSAQVFQQFAQLLDSKLDKKLACFKRSLDNKDEFHASQIKKLKSESKAAGSFKFKGNKIQFEFNVDVRDGLELMTKCLLGGDLTQVNAEIEKQKSVINKRNKLIRFADKSPAGWTAVEEYESNELAENSDDEKKLRSAEKRAMGKNPIEKAIFQAFVISCGCIVECVSPPTVVSPLSVAVQSSGKKRLILDLRYPNSFLKKHWRSKAHKIVVYLDDGTGPGSDFESCVKQSHSVKSDLVNSGFFPNEGKSTWFPSQCITWLGFVGIERAILSVPQGKLLYC